MRLKQCVVYPAFQKDMDLAALFKAAAGIGFRAVEMWNRAEDFERVVALAREHGLAVVSMCGHQRTPDGLNARAAHERIERELAESIDLAVKAGIGNLICFSGDRHAGQAEADAIETAAAGLRRIVPYAEAKNVTLNMELLNSRIDHKGYQCDRTAWGVAVCQKVNSPRVKLLYDIYHMQIMEGDVIRTIRDSIQWIGHFHTAGVPGRHDLDDEQELNYGAICRAIAATGYGGYVGHEFWPKGDKVEALRRAFALCDVG